MSPLEGRARALRELFEQICVRLDREPDDVLAEMLEQYMGSVGLRAGGPPSPSPEATVGAERAVGEPSSETCSHPTHAGHGAAPPDRTGSYSCPKCRNAHELAAVQRVSGALARMQEALEQGWGVDPEAGRRLRGPRGSRERPFTLADAMAIERERRRQKKP